VNLTVSPQIRILAIVGLLAAAGLGASMLLLGHSGSKTETSAAVTRAHTTPAVPARTKPHTHAKPATHPKHVAKAHAVPRVHHKAAKPAGFRGNPVYSDLPEPLQWELAHHKVVVVSLYDPASDVDAISVAEAHAGAMEAGVGFLLVNVLDNKIAGILTALMPDGGLLPDPGVLVYRAPGELAIRIDGFSDREAVAQAATNVLAGESGPAAPASPSALPAVTTTPAVPAAAPTPATATTP
jgi:hypothetical protein